MAHYLVIALESLLFIYASYLFGALALRLIRAEFSMWWEKAAYAVMLGYGAFGLAGLLLALNGQLSSGPLWLLVGAIGLVSAPILKSHLVRIFSFVRVLPDSLAASARSFFREHGFLKAIVLLWLCTNFIIVFMPLTGHDTLDYHLPVMQEITTTHGIVFSTTNLLQIPVFGELMYAVSSVLFGATDAPYPFQVIQYTSLPLLLLVVAGFLTGRVAQSFLVPTSALLILSIMDLEREVLHGGYVDVFAFLFGIAAVLLILRNVLAEKLSASEFLLSAVFLGLSLSIKYTGFIFGAVVVALIIVGFIRQRPSLGVMCRLLFCYAGIIFLVAGVWYLKNFFLFGNPLYPMFSVPEFSEQIQWFIMDRNFLNFLAFPFYRFGQWFIQDVETSSRLVVLGYFIVSYALMFFFALARRLKLPELLLFASVQAYLAFLFISSHQYRFLLPAEILLVPLLVILFDRLYAYVEDRWSKRLHEEFLRLSHFAAPIAFVILFAANIHYFYVKWSYVVGIYTEKEYIIVIGGQ